MVPDATVIDEVEAFAKGWGCCPRVMLLAAAGCLDGCGRRRLDAARLRSWLQAPDAGMAVRRRTSLASSVLAISPLAVFSNVLQNSTLAPVSRTSTWAVHRRNKPLSVPPGRCARC